MNELSHHIKMHLYDLWDRSESSGAPRLRPTSPTLRSGGLRGSVGRVRISPTWHTRPYRTYYFVCVRFVSPKTCFLQKKEIKQNLLDPNKGPEGTNLDSYTRV